MRCKKCGRLSPDDVNVCKFCGEVFDESKPAEDVVPSYQTGYEIDPKTDKNKKAPKYFKWGWLVIAAAVVLVALIICLIIF